MHYTVEVAEGLNRKGYTWKAIPGALHLVHSNEPVEKFNLEITLDG